jgi:glycosyltransferase involved in cell wall biosynthesis
MAKNRFIFLTQNETIKRMSELYMGGILAGRVICLPLGVDTVDKFISSGEARRHFGLPQNRRVLLSFGFLHAGKDVEVMFRALRDVPQVFLLHGGDQMFRIQLPNSIDLVEKYNMLDRTIIRDNYIPEEEKPYYFFAADAVILSYTKRFLATTSLLWQACRFGIPVIASDNGELKELVETHKLGLVFEAEDANSLHEAVIRFVSMKPEEIKSLKHNCLRFAREFSLNNWAQKCIEIYNQLLATENSRSKVGRKVE